jgi:group I intron endonuclease
MYIIYKVINKLNNKVYVGMTSKTLLERFNGHIKSAKKPKYRLHQAIHKHGEENFIVEELEKVTSQEEANEKEIFWISFFDSTNYSFGYNMSNGGQGSSIKTSEEKRNKIKQKVQEHRDSLSPEQKKEMTKAANEKKKGSIESEESKERKSQAQKIRWNSTSEEQRKEHGKKSSDNRSEESKINDIKRLNECYNPAKQKGFKHKIVECPYCNKTGGLSAMKKYHFDNCKSKQ